MRRTHVSDERSIVVEPRDQPNHPAMKPRGFWYEVNADWRRWCRSEMPHWIEGKHLHRVSLGSESMLVIRDALAYDDFEAAYLVSEYVSGRYWNGQMDKGIAWDRVAARWDGIEIAPYLWHRRLNGAIWYYGWDCASGVVWRPRGITVEWARRLPGVAVPA